MDILLAAAVVPAVYLLYYVYRADPVEKEPMSLLLRLLALGALSCIPAILLEMLGTNILLNGLPAYSVPTLLIENFVVIALSEELCKFIFLRLRTWNNPEFNYVFDGIVYAVFVSLGFAILENIGYVMEFGMGTALVRAFTAIPGHAVFGVFMGCFYGLAKRAEHAGRKGEKTGYLVAALAVPVLCHGFYDFCASIDNGLADLVFFAFLIALMFVAMRLVKHMSRVAHPIHDSAYSSGVQPPYAPYDSIVDNSLDGGSHTYTGANQYGGASTRYPTPPNGYDNRGPFS
ncbi:MAG: PrsW family intramembrane metalloprotease [Eggerthellaceae bacterium]|nr:PrsW family intramembrane metalloprotease [Eggerthellaceae bacterium]